MIKSTLRKVFSSPNFVYGSTRTIIYWQIKLQFGDLFINFLHKQVLNPYAATKPFFLDFGWSFEHHISETNSVTPQFLMWVTHNLKLVKVSQKKSMLKDFRVNVLKFLQRLALDFPYICLYFFPRLSYKQMYRKLKKSGSRSSSECNALSFFK